MEILEQRAAVVAIIAAILVSTNPGLVYDEDGAAEEAFDLLAASVRCVARKQPPTPRRQTPESVGWICPNPQCSIFNSGELKFCWKCRHPSPIVPGGLIGSDA